MSGCCPPSRSQGQEVPQDLPDRGHASGDLVVLPGGTFLMGTEDADGFPADNEGPVREVTVASFAIDPYCVSNARFAEFVDATGYRTDAEKFGWTYVFAKFLPGELRKKSPRPQQTPWWRRPLGPPGGARVMA
jgi:formylglycine-generating enzyme required for sulfatase activity